MNFLRRLFGKSEPESLVLNITAEDISTGLQHMGHHCPATLAAERLFPGATSILAGISTLFVWYEDHTQFYRAPELEEFIHKFDKDRESVRPIQIALIRSY